MYRFIFLFNIIILCSFTILGVVLPYRDGNSLWTILSLLWLFIEPMKFCYRRKYKRSISKWYHIILLLSEFIILCFIIHRTEFSFFGIYIIIAILLILNRFTKKEIYTREKNISKLLFMIMGICFFSIYFGNTNLGLFGIPIGVALGIFSFLLVFLFDRVESEQLRPIYFFMMVGAIITKQPICFILTLRLWLDLDYF